MRERKGHFERKKTAVLAAFVCLRRLRDSNLSCPSRYRKGKSV
jgi:hypothetical protein